MSDLITNVIPLPDFLEDIGGNITGTITINREFQEHPTAQVNILASLEEIGTIREKLRGNFTTKFLFYNIPFRIRNYNEKENLQTVYPEGYYEITVDFEGFWKKLTNDPLLLREKAFNAESLDPWEAPECGIDNTPQALLSGELAHPYKRNTLIIYLSTLAERAGVSYTGDGLFAEFADDAPYFATTTLNSEINGKLNTLQKIVKYSKESGLVTQEWDVATSHELGEEDIIQPIAFSVNSEKVEYINTELNWNKYGIEEASLEFEEIQLQEIEDTLNNNIPVFEAEIPDVYELTTGADNEDLFLPPVDELDSIQMAWDASGPTKTQTTTTYEGSTIIKERELTYGFAFNGYDIYKPVGANGFPELKGAAAIHWKPVKDITTVYDYDPGTGYSLGSRTTGFILSRFIPDFDLSGSEKDGGAGGYFTHTTKIQFEFDGPSRLQMYQFTKQAYTARRSFLLKQFNDYYEDGSNLRDQFVVYQYCDTDGQLRNGYVIDPTYVEPMFISAVDYVVDSVDKKINTDQQNFAAAPMVEFKTRGEETFDSESIEIFQSELTKSNANLLGKKLVGEGDDRYRKTSIQSRAQDGDMKNFVTTQSIEEVTGRPGVQGRKPSQFQLKDLKVDNNNATTNVDIRRKELRRQVKALEKLKKQVYLMNTGDNNPAQTAPRGSIFVNTDEEEVAVKTAKFLIEEQEFRQGERSSLTTFFNQNIEEGDFVTFTYNGLVRKRRILSVNHVIQFEGTTVGTAKINDDGTVRRLNQTSVVTALTQLQLGVVSELGDQVKVTIFDETGTIVDPENNNPAIDDTDYLDVLLPPYYTDRELGERVPFRSKR